MSSLKQNSLYPGLIILVSILFMNVISFGQIQKEASSGFKYLEDKIKKIIPDSLNMADSIAYELVKIGKESNDSLEAIGWYYKAEVAFYSGQIDDAGDFYKKCLSLIEPYSAPQRKAIYYNNLGLTRYFKDRNNEALEAYLKSAEFEKKVGNEYGFAQCLHNIALVHDRVGNDENAENYFDHSLNIFFELDSLDDAAAVFNDYAIFLSRRGRNDEAIQKYKQAFEIYNESGNFEDAAKVKCNIGALYLYQKEYTKSADLLEESLDYFKTLEQSSYLINIYSLFGDLYYEQGRTALSVVFYDRAEAVARKMGRDNLRQKNLYSLFKALKAENDYKNALDVLETYSRFKDSLIVINQGFLETSMDNEIETELMEKELNLVNAQMREKNLVLIILALLLILGVFAWFLYGRTRGLRAEKEKRELQQKILHMQMNPHFMFNAMTSLQSYILNNQKEEASDYLSDIAQLIRKIMCVADKELISLEEEMELIEMYLKVQCRRFYRTINCGVDSRIISGSGFLKVPPMLPRPIIDDVFAYGNMGDHSCPGINISYEQKENELEVIVESKGAVPSKTMKANSLSLIEERLKSFVKIYKGGRIYVEKVDVVKEGQISGAKIKYWIPIIRSHN
ncbi:tetratricopeptide repeat protein [Marinilabilia rubra]|uniref:Histidine kinase n=1 Tax=Marinilabilia rubra TaxID=2162893 RepID=A0A2U2B7U1_9BACT|nr:tetratricopeptide repeat protein [Marinilabilia rubra]PWD99128.1 histidine kinase [Marinilabilia rubra]